MKKIMFNDKYGLTRAVLEGRKTMTRRIVPQSVVDYYTYEAEDPTMIDAARFEVGEIVAVAMAYKDAWVEWQNLWEKSNDPNNWRTPDAMLGDQADTTRGWSNKMFVKVDLMPHQIRITDIKVERLQDISNEDCLNEGIYKDVENGSVIGSPLGVPFFYTFYGAVGKETGRQLHWTTPQEAFSALIDKISGKGTWKANPWVYVYEFELIK